MPSDHLIADLAAFHQALAEGAEQAAAGAVVAFGITPLTPETGYGYIRTGDAVAGAKTARTLAAFAEKPDAETAGRYLAEGGYLWNSGMFMVRASVWLAAIERFRPDIAAACRTAVADARTDGVFVRLGKAAFSACPSESIDYAVMERLGRRTPRARKPARRPGAAAQGRGHPARSRLVRPGGMGRGLGRVGQGRERATWSAATSSSTIRADSLVQAQSRLVAALGSRRPGHHRDGRRRARRQARQEPPISRSWSTASHAHDKSVTQIHRRVYRPWGWYESIDQGPRFQVKRLMVAPGASMSLQYHQHRAEHWVVVSGVAEVTCDGRVFRLEENASTYVPAGAAHRLANPGTEPVEIIEVQSGDYLGEDDIVRLEDVYGRMEDK